MTKLLIYRGDAVHGEYELKGRTVRIGRSPQNDIVLEDPSKGVSRNHAEIRAEGGHYMLVDLESQNGIWVHGSRVPSVRLDPGVTAALGPFRLTTVEVAAAESPAARAEVVTEPTEYSHPQEARTVPEAVDGAGALLDTPGPSAASPGTAQIPVTPPAGTPAQPHAASGTPRRSSAPVLAAAVAVLVVLGASALAGYAWLHKRAPKPVWDPQAAVALVNDGKCAEAMQEQIGPALNANPNDAEALALKDRCAPPPAPAPPSAPAPPPAPVEKTVAQKLDDVEAALAANNCQAALDAVNAVLSDNPDDTRAKDLAAKANACLTPAPTPATPEPAPGPVKIAAAQGGLDVQPGESQREYTRRVAAMRKRYEDAAALVQGQHYQQALKELDAIAAAVPSGYLDLGKLRADARTGIKDEAAGVYASARQAEQQGDLNAALQRYERAHEMDSSIDVSTDTARVNDQKVKLGHQACTTGHANFALGHNADAALQYQRVLDFLPDSDPCYAIAKQRLAQIKR
ncbi:MAG TPA: FHA domain-containing protein [Vicinamibacterales bacterium]|nr:FHA domain-containing protein [Vicinamibacterales bacterium]